MAPPVLLQDRIHQMPDLGVAAHHPGQHFVLGLVVQLASKPPRRDDGYAPSSRAGVAGHLAEPDVADRAQEHVRPVFVEHLYRGVGTFQGGALGVCCVHLDAAEAELCEVAVLDLGLGDGDGGLDLCASPRSRVGAAWVSRKGGEFININMAVFKALEIISLTRGCPG